MADFFPFEMNDNQTLILKKNNNEIATLVHNYILLFILSYYLKCYVNLKDCQLIMDWKKIHYASQVKNNILAKL